MDNSHDIQLYKPNVSVQATFEVDEKLPDAELTFDLFKKLVLARKTEDYLFLVIGKMLKITRDRKLYKHLDYDNFSQFLADENIDFSREKAYMYIRIYETYVERLELSEESIAKMGVKRLNIMTSLFKDKTPEQAREIMESKQGMRYGAFVREVREETNKDGKPSVYFSEESKTWVINYYEDRTHLVPLGKFPIKEDNDA